MTDQSAAVDSNNGIEVKIDAEPSPVDVALDDEVDPEMEVPESTRSSSLPLSPRTTPRMGSCAVSGESRMRIKTNGSLGRSGSSGGATPTGISNSSTATATASSSSSLCASTGLAAAAAAALNGDNWTLNLAPDFDGNSSLGLSDEDLRLAGGFDDDDDEEDLDEDAIGLEAAQMEEDEEDGKERRRRDDDPPLRPVRRTASMNAAKQENGETLGRRRTNSEGRNIDVLLLKRRQLNGLKKQLRYFHQAKRDVLQRLMQLKQQITEVESREMETMREMELERALLDGEYQSELSLVRMEKDHMLNLRKEHTVQLQILLDEQNENEEAIEVERQRLVELEDQHSALERKLKKAEEQGDEDVAEMRNQLEALEEVVEAQRKVYEDLEFQQLEDQARFDEEREGMLQELMIEQNGMLDKYRERENRLQALDSQQTSMLADVRKNIDQLETDRRSLIEQFKKEKTKLAIADCRISELSRQFASVNISDNPSSSSTSEPKNHVSSSAAASASISAAAASVGSPEPPPHSNSVSSAPEPATNGWTAPDSESGSGGSSSLGTQSNPSLSGQQGATGSSSSREEGLGNGVQLRGVNRDEQSRPLTRYLPVVDPAFNLRRYIEGSGHPVDMCRNKVHIAAQTCRGYLWKMGGGIKSWRKRWFVFDRRYKRLIYCSRSPKHHGGDDDLTENELVKAKGRIAFRDILDVFVDHLRRVKSPNPSLTFCVETSQRLFYLLAPSAEVMRIWVDVLFTGAEGYLLINAPSLLELEPT